MNYFKKILIIFFLLFPFSHTFASVVTLVDSFQVSNGDEHTTVRAGLSINTDREVGGVQFNNDGTKMFVRFFRDEGGETDYSFIDEYNLSIPFDASSGTYAGDDQRCELNHGLLGTIGHQPFDFYFSNDGMHFYFANRYVGGGTKADKNSVLRFDLTAPFDISTCSYSQRTSNLLTDANRNNSLAGDDELADTAGTNRLMGVSLSNDGKKMFIITFFGFVLEFDLSTPYDITTFSVNNDAGIDLSSHLSNPMSIEFSEDGKRFFISNHNSDRVVQISLDAPFDTSSHTVDGFVDLNTAAFGNMDQMRHATFSKNGLTMYISNDDSGTHKIDQVYEFSLDCPFNIIATATCQTYTSKGRTAMAEAQAELAKRTINLSTNSALNRLKWIRRNKDKQNLSNQNIKLNFSNNLISSISQLPITSFKKIVSSKNKDKSDQKYFYWSEGSVSIGRIGDTSISQSKRIEANSLTFGFDKFTEKKGIQGYAFRFGNDETTLHLGESELDSETFNITYYSSAPIKDDNRLVDRIFGIGKIRSDILTNIDGKKFTADRNGNQIYGTIKIKDELRKDNLIIIPSGQFDIGHTLLDRYEESGQNNGVIVDKQHVKTKNLRATLAVVEDLSNDKFEFKRHGKIEYLVDLDRSSDFKYSYNFDKETKYAEKLHTGSLHNINAEIGLDIVFPNRYSIFVIYERNQTIKSAHSAQNDNLYIAIGYLPYEGAEYAFTINGSENLLSKLEFKKNVNGLNLSFNVNDDLTNLGDNREANIVLNKVF